MKLSINEIDMTHIVPEYTLPKVYLYSKNFTETKCYTNLSQVIEDFGKDSNIISYSSHCFRRISPIWFTNSLDNIDLYSFVFFDKTISLSDFYDSNCQLTVDKFFSNVYFVEKDLNER